MELEGEVERADMAIPEARGADGGVSLARAGASGARVRRTSRGMGGGDVPDTRIAEGGGRVVSTGSWEVVCWKEPRPKARKSWTRPTRRGAEAEPAGSLGRKGVAWELRAAAGWRDPAVAGRRPPSAHSRPGARGEWDRGPARGHVVAAGGSRPRGGRLPPCRRPHCARQDDRGEWGQSARGPLRADRPRIRTYQRHHLPREQMHDVTGSGPVLMARCSRSPACLGARPQSGIDRRLGLGARRSQRWVGTLLASISKDPRPLVAGVQSAAWSARRGSANNVHRVSCPGSRHCRPPGTRSSSRPALVLVAPMFVVTGTGGAREDRVVLSAG